MFSDTNTGSCVSCLTCLAPSAVCAAGSPRLSAHCRAASPASTLQKSNPCHHAHALSSVGTHSTHISKPQLTQGCLDVASAAAVPELCKAHMGRTRPSDSGCLPSAARRDAARMGLATPAAQQRMTQQSAGARSSTTTGHVPLSRCSTSVQTLAGMTTRCHHRSWVAAAVQHHKMVCSSSTR